jgi:hypothetical protein
MSEIKTVNVQSLLEEHLRSSEHSWSIGISGAIGEFMYDENEEIELQVSEDEISVLTERGAMSIKLGADIKCLAYEEMSSCTRSWSQSVVFCIPEEQAKLRGNNVLTDLGIDKNSVNALSRGKQLFDLGLDSEKLQFCIRTDNEEFLKILEENYGRSIFDGDNPVTAAVLEHSPARVVISALGRIEIETRIPTTASETLSGPHTHLLPGLLKAKRDAGVDLPSGYVEVLSLYPEHPAFDKYGESRSFNKMAHDKFQNLLGQIGPEGYTGEKSRINSLRPTREDDKKASTEVTKHLQIHRIAKIQAPFLADLSS